MRFVNADLIAAGLSPFSPESAAIKAGRLMLEEIAGCVRRGESFAFETTLLSGRSYLRHIRRWHPEGYHVSLFFLSLPNAETAIARVAMRAPRRARYPRKNHPAALCRGLAKFERDYKAAVDAWAVYDNSGEKPTVIPVPALSVQQLRRGRGERAGTRLS
ncbi:MAG TPA: hypothetical protein VG326_01910 [Tepidisphaeraceae bacterium]|nr:hypothetical protein [Tepidisphaeraceae bacterium]